MRVPHVSLHKKHHNAMKTKERLTLLAVLSVLHTAAAASEPSQLAGDIGLGAVHAPSEIRGERGRTSAVPYLNLTYGTAFARIDTFGVQILPIGYGHLEVLTQVRGDGYEASGLQRRRDALPLGMGTLQITPVGAFGLHVLHDFGKSGGTLVQARYLAEFPLGRVSIYPEVGAEYQSRSYANYYVGTTASDAAYLGRAYRPDAALNPYVGGLIEVRLHEHWVVSAYLRRSFVDNTISGSPLVAGNHRDSVLIAFARRL